MLNWLGSSRQFRLQRRSEVCHQQRDQRVRRCLVLRWWVLRWWALQFRRYRYRMKRQGKQKLGRSLLQRDSAVILLSA